MKLSCNIRRILKGGAPVPLYFFALAPIAWIYALIVSIRAYLYRIGAFKTNSLPCKVVSVGNITAGGTGKTPMVIDVARRILKNGLKAAIVTRGYGGGYEGRVAVVSDGSKVLLGPDDCGDEAAMLAESLPGVPVVMGSDRYRAGLLAVERFGPDVIILDDGFQHMFVRRDLNILLLDAGRPFGNGFTLPLGYLREPMGAVQRADLVVLTRADIAETADIRAAASSVADIAPAIPVIRAAHRPMRLRGVWGGGDVPLSEIAGRGVLAVSGIADPASFTLILQKLNAKITGSLDYDDHHAYSVLDLKEIEAKAAETGAFMVVTTEKDAVKLKRLAKPGFEMSALCIEMEQIEGEGALEGILNDRIMGLGRA